MSLKNTDVVVLCGGRGTRLRRLIGAMPKCLAPINGKPFLDYLFEKLQKHAAERIFLCTGHGHEAVVAWAKARKQKIHISHERNELGTGGALQLVRPFLKSDPVLVMNGDTMVDADLGELLTHHDGGITDFELRRFGSPSHYASCGVRLFSQASLDEFCALGTEEDGTALYQNFLAEKATVKQLRNYVYVDIGNPKTYRNAPLTFRAVQW